MDLADTVYALDATIIDLCLSLFLWAKFRTAKAAVKLHTLLDLRGAIPSFIHISDGKLHDVNVLDVLIAEPGAFYVMDRGYLDFERLYRLHQAASFFVTRAKSNFKFKRVYSRPVDRSTGLLCDQEVQLVVFYSQQAYPERLRRIRYRDAEGRRLVFLTNHMTLVYTFLPFIKAGLPIKSLPDMKEGTYTSCGSSALSVVKNSPHPNATKVFINWLLGKEGQEIYGKAMGQATRRFDVETKWMVEHGVRASKDFLTVEENSRLENYGEDTINNYWAKSAKIAEEVFK